MRNFITGVLALILFAVIIGAIIWLIVMPRLDFGRSINPPGNNRAKVGAECSRPVDSS